MITTVVDPWAKARDEMATAAVGEEETISIFATADCSGPELASGGAAEFANSGIPVEVLPGSTTTFHAVSADAAGTSSCSNGITYRHVEDPPGQAVVTGVTPASPADDNLPLVSGGADADSTVQIFANPGCTGSPLATGSAASFSAEGIQVPVPDNSTTSFYALASWAELPAPCSSTSVTYQEVTAPSGDPGPNPPAEPNPAAPGVGDPVPPLPVSPGTPGAPRLHTEPGGRAHDTQPRVVGSAVRGVSFEIFRSEDCAGPRAAIVSAAEFAAGVPVRVEPNSTTSFSAIAVDGDGERSRCSPEPVSFVEDSAAPVTRITFGPGSKTHRSTAVFRFADITGEPPGVSYSCKLDKRPWRTCQSPWRVPKLRPRAHLALVRAVDPAGNEEAVPAKRRFKVVGRPSR